MFLSIFIFISIDALPGIHVKFTFAHYTIFSFHSRITPLLWPFLWSIALKAPHANYLAAAAVLNVRRLPPERPSLLAPSLSTFSCWATRLHVYTIYRKFCWSSLLFSACSLLSMLPTSPRQRLAHHLLGGVLEDDVKHHTLIYLRNRKTIKWLVRSFLVILFSKVLRLLVILHIFSLVNAPLRWQILVATKPPIFRIFSSLLFFFVVL